MTARMVATHRNYTRQQKAAYRARVARRHHQAHLHRMPLRIAAAADGLRDSIQRARRGLQSLAAALPHPDDLPTARQPWVPKIPSLAEQRVTAEQLLGMDPASAARRRTLEQLLELPPTPLQTYLGEFANEHQADAHNLPEGWTER